MEASPPTSLLSALRAAYRAARLDYRDRLAPLDLTARQAAVIRALAARPGLGLGAIAEAVGADQPTASALVDRLVERGLVARAADPSDRRRTCLRLTSAAEALAEAVQHERAAMDARLVDALGAARAAELLALLGALTARLGDDARDGEGDD